MPLLWLNFWFCLPWGHTIMYVIELSWGLRVVGHLWVELSWVDCVLELSWLLCGWGGYICPLVEFCVSLSWVEFCVSLSWVMCVTELSWVLCVTEFSFVCHWVELSSVCHWVELPLQAVVHGVIFYVALRVVEVRMSDGDVADACRRRHNAAITTTYVDVDTPTDREQEDVDVSAERTRVSTWDMSEQVTSPRHHLIYIISLLFYQ